MKQKDAFTAPDGSQGTLYREPCRGVLVTSFHTEMFEVERGLAKCVVNLLASCRGRDFVLGSAFDDVRSFVRYGDPIVCCSSPCQITQRHKSQKQTHYIRMYVDGNVLVSRCEFFEVVKFMVVLAERSPARVAIDERLRAVF